MDIAQLWATCLGELEVLLSKANFTTWFKDTSIAKIDGDTVIIGTPNSFTREWLEKKYHDQILQTISKQHADVKHIEYIVSSTKGKVSVTMAPESTTPESMHDEIATHGDKKAHAGMIARYLFQSFVVGESNKLAHAAAIAVAKNPGVTYNPLFIYGGVGLGKTHLMQAIGNEIQKTHKNKKVVYTTCEKFINEFISLIQQGKGEKFKNMYRTVDVLLIDDIQFLEGKESTQIEFFHTFNALHSADKQIVITSDRPPKAMPKLEDRLVSRFEWGMIADISPPTLETRIAILKSKILEKGYAIGDDIVEHIAKNIRNNVRELEGALTRIIAYCELNDTSPEIENVKQILGGSLVASADKSASPRDVLKKIADYYDISLDDLLGPRRNKEFVYPRQISAYILREDLNLSFPKIGKELGGKDHTTIMHACTKITKEATTSDVVKHELNSIREKLYVF